MEEFVRLFVGIIFLALGWPIGNFLVKVTKDETRQGQFWFKMIVSLSLVLGFISLIFGNDILMFSFFFIALVTSRSLKR